MEVVVIADVWQELAVCLHVAFPIYTEVFRIEEALLHLLLHMVVHIFTLCSRVELHLRTERYRCEFAAAWLHLLEAAARKHEDALAITTQFHATTSGILRYQLRLTLAQIHLPEVVATFEARKVE